MVKRGKSMIKNITKGGLLVALGVLLPVFFHLIGASKVGQMLSPMHIPVLLAGFILGPVYGFLVGLITPIASFLITSMPTAERLIFMVGELAVYGLSAGYIYKKLEFNKKKYGIYISLISAMILGRAVYIAMVFVAGNLLNMVGIGVAAAISSMYTGIPGIIVQIIIVPVILLAMGKGGLLESGISNVG